MNCLTSKVVQELFKIINCVTKRKDFDQQCIKHTNGKNFGIAYVWKRHVYMAWQIVNTFVLSTQRKVT